MPDEPTSAAPGTAAVEPAAGQSYIDDIAARHGVRPEDVLPPAEPAAEPAPAPAPAASAGPSIHERWRERTLSPVTDPYAPLREEIGAVRKRLDDLAAPAKPTPPSVDKPEEYLQYHLREVLAPLVERVEALDRRLTEGAEAGQRAGIQESIVRSFAELESEYEREVPGHRDRFNRYVALRAEEVAREYNIPQRDAHAAVLDEIGDLLRRAGRLRVHPVGYVDREVSLALTARGIDTGASPQAAAEPGAAGAGRVAPSPAPAAPASRAIRERAAAARSAVAGSLSGAPAAGGPHKITARALLKELNAPARTGEDEERNRKLYEQAVAERVPEYGNATAAIQALNREMAEAGASQG